MPLIVQPPPMRLEYTNPEADTQDISRVMSAGWIIIASWIDKSKKMVLQSREVIVYDPQLHNRESKGENDR